MRKSFVAENRILISKIIVIPIIAIFFIFTPNIMHYKLINAFCEFLGFTLAIVGVLGRIFSSIFMGNNRDKSIVTEGIYSTTRNPLYFFSFISGLGVIVAYGSVIFLILFIVIFYFFYYFVIKAEEKYLSNIFKDEYLTYKKSSPRFFPNFKLFHITNEYITTSYKSVLKTSIDSSLLLIITIVIIIVKHLNPIKDLLLIW